MFICYGAIMGVGLGIGYLTPVKNLMLWFADNKGLATGIAVAGLSGNQLASFVVTHAPDQAHRYAALIPVLIVLFIIALISISLVKAAGKRVAVA